jgi:hypothetical protein
MHVILPSSLLLQFGEISSWMLYPDRLAISQRIDFCAFQRRARYLSIYTDSRRKKPPLPYLWKNSAADELSITPNPDADGIWMATPIIGDENGNLLSLVSDMLVLHREVDIGKDRLELSYRKGFTAGTLLLACYIFDSEQAPGHKSSKARGTVATARITGLKERSVENFFREFNSVAHLWASYLLCSSQIFFNAESAGILEYTNNGVPTDFIDHVDIERFLSIADQLANYGQLKATGKTALIAEAEILRFSPSTTLHHPLLATPEFIDVFLKNYPSGKRDTRA